jgi:quinol monooxygenase YgiN
LEICLNPRSRPVFPLKFSTRAAAASYEKNLEQPASWHPTSIHRCVILTVLQMKSPPARKLATIQALRSLMRAARAERGFIACDLYLNADTENAIRYEEQWQSREELEDQVRSPRYTQLLALMESASERPSLTFLFVSETRGLEYVAAVRNPEGANA